MISEFEDERPRTPKAEVRRREREAQNKLISLLKAKDERTLIDLLTHDFGITPSDPRFAEILKIWRERR
jgi:hypothetical protein